MAARRRSFVPRLAVLEDRCVPALTSMDNGLLVYDSDARDVTADATKGAKGVCWLADANLAATMTFGVKGINPDGSMTWETAINWVAALNSYNNGAGYLGHNNWSLPGTLPNDPNATLTGPAPNRDSFGYDCAASPMGHLFYAEFGGSPGDTLSTLPSQASVGLFKDFQPYYYWSATWEPTRTLPADFSFGSGFLGTDKDIDFEYAIPEFSCDASLNPVDPSDLPAPLPNNHPNANDLVQPTTATPTLTVYTDGTIYDAALNVNWLANADLAKTNTFGIALGLNPDPTAININPDGSMNQDTAVAWIAAMNAADYLGHNNWRLPISPDLAPQGYYKTGTEMGELFYSELGSQAGSTILLTHNGYEPLFQNFQPYYYWSSSQTNGKAGTDSDSRESFSFGTGYRSDNTHTNFMYVLPVYGPPQVVSVGENNGADQRSMVASIQVTFSTTVSIAPGALTLTYIGGPTGTVSSTVGNFTVSTATVGGVTVASLSNFNGTDTTAGISATGFGSLIDGRYAVKVTGSAVTAGGVPMAADFTFADSGSTTGNQLYRLFGDSNGDRVVDVADLTSFRSVYGATATDFAFDVDLNGVINVADLAAFRAHFGAAI
jgi:hypothetical protein